MDKKRQVPRRQKSMFANVITLDMLNVLRRNNAALNLDLGRPRGVWRPCIIPGLPVDFDTGVRIYGVCVSLRVYGS